MISVIMLTHNRKEYVENMINDILGQSYADFEFIIVDNGSVDGTDKILEEYKQKDDRITYFHIPEGSVGYGRNFGVKASQGEYVTFVDDDDRVEDDYLDFLYSMLIEEKADIAICGITEEFEGEVSPQCVFDERVVLDGSQAVEKLLERKYIRAGLPTKLIKRKILESYPFREDCTHEDIYTTYKYLASAEKVVLWGKGKYRCIRHRENISFFTSDQSRWTNEIIKEYLNAFKERTAFLKRVCPDLYLLAQYSEWSYMISMVDKIEQYNIEGCRGIEQELINILHQVGDKFLNMPWIKEFEIEWMHQYIG